MGDVSIDIADDRELLHQVSNLEIGPRHSDELDYFVPDIGMRYRDAGTMTTCFSRPGKSVFWIPIQEKESG